MKKLYYYLVMMKAYMRIGIITFTEYPLDSIIWCVAMFAREAASFFGIFFICKMLGGLGAWTLYEICILFGMAMIPEAIGQCFFDSVWNIGTFIRDGTLDKFIVRPLPIIMQLLGNRYTFQAVITIISGGIIIYYGIYHAMVSFTIGKFLLLILFIICGTSINTSIYLIFNSLNFWIIQGNDIAYLVLTIRQFAKYPITIFPKAVEITISYVIPFAFVSYYPTLYLIGKGTVFIPICTVFIAILLPLIAIGIWNCGMKKYDSTGT